MAQNFIDPDILRNYVNVANERGMTLGQVADMVENESPQLAAALRESVDVPQPTKKARVERAVTKPASTR